MGPSDRQELPNTTSWHTPIDPARTPPELIDHPRYRLVEVLGEGGMGTVFKAEHRLMKRWVAIKVVRNALLENPAIRERFFRELRTAGRLAHPNVVVAHDAEQAGDICFLVMEYVPGESLSELVKRRGPLSIAEACGHVRQAALGLQHVHERGLVHRDIKPGNLLLTPDGRVKVLDFGLARFTLEQATELTGPGAVLGTPAYMAPEQARNAPDADIRADVYSLGRTLAYLLAGRHTTGPLSRIRPDVPPQLTAVLERMLAEDSAARYQTPIEVAEALAPFIKTKRSPPDRSGRRRRWIALATAVGFLGLFGLVVGLGYAVGGMLKKTAATTAPDRQNELAGPTHEGTSSPTVPRNESQRATSITLMVDKNPAGAGQPIMFTATVLPLGPDAGSPRGKVDFRDGGEVLAEVDLVGNQATLTTSTLGTGTHSVIAGYRGDADFLGSTSQPLMLSVSETQQITVVGGDGTFTLTFDNATTNGLQSRATAEDVKNALAGLPTVGGRGGSVIVTRMDNVITVTFAGSLAGMKQPLIRAAGQGTAVTVTRVGDGENPKK